MSEYRAAIYPNARPVEINLIHLAYVSSRSRGSLLSFLTNGKEESHEDDEVLDFWSTYEATGEHHDPANASTPHFLHLNVQYTAPPANISTRGDSSPFSGLADMLSSSGRTAALSVSPSTWAEELLSPAPEPDDQLACFDDLYAASGGEWEENLGPTWDLIGTNMRFTRHMDLLATSFLKGIFDIRQFDVIPPVRGCH
ncbi:hypothetical protein FRC01_004040 [Tulasnella sp. 417]|nr:hypothetical protein FRC01_004040 [Tulasnella sp. 417]